MAWLQRNIELATPKLASARKVFAELENHTFFFQRKPPDLRLRLKTDIDATLDALVESKAIVRWFPSIYEPERARFGGKAGMRAAHRFFSEDTRLWIALDRAYQRGEGQIPPDILIVAVLNELFVEQLADAAEVFDVWWRYGEQLPRDASQWGRVRSADLNKSASEAEKHAMNGYREATHQLVEALTEAWNSGDLKVGIRAYLARIALFTLNRHGMDLAAHTRIASAMIEAWSPRP